MLKEKRETLKFLALAEKGRIMEATKEKHATHADGQQIEDCTPGESTGLRFEVGTKIASLHAQRTDGRRTPMRV